MHANPANPENSRLSSFCVRCNANFAGWSCRVEQSADGSKRIFYEYSTPPGRQWAEMSQEEAMQSGLQAVENETLARLLLRKVGPAVQPHVAQQPAAEKAILLSKDECELAGLAGLSYQSYIKVLVPAGRKWVMADPAPGSRSLLVPRLQDRLRADFLPESMTLSQQELESFELPEDLSHDTHHIFVPSGLEWEHVVERPSQGRELRNLSLAAALKLSLELLAGRGGEGAAVLLTQQDWEACEIKNLHSDDFIVVGESMWIPGRGGTCYRPSADGYRFFKPDESHATTRTFASLDEITVARNTPSIPSDLDTVTDSMKELFDGAGLAKEAFDFEQNFCCASCAPGVHCFSTCVAVINSALYKLAQHTELVPGRILYRGLNGMVCFFVCHLLCLCPLPVPVRARHEHPLMRLSRLSCFPATGLPNTSAGN